MSLFHQLKSQIDAKILTLPSGIQLDAVATRNYYEYMKKQEQRIDPFNFSFIPDLKLTAYLLIGTLVMPSISFLKNITLSPIVPFCILCFFIALAFIKTAPAFTFFRKQGASLFQAFEQNSNKSLNSKEHYALTRTYYLISDLSNLATITYHFAITYLISQAMNWLGFNITLEVAGITGIFNLNQDALYLMYGFTLFLYTLVKINSIIDVHQAFRRN